MTQSEYDKFVEALKSRGYREYPPINHASHTFFKGFGREINPYEKERALYQIAFSVYDWRKYADRDRSILENPYSIDTTIMVSRTIDERLDLNIGSKSEIDYVEDLASKFINWIEQNVTIKLWN